MKKLLTMVAAVSAALFFTKADAQVRTYFEDSFSPSGPSSSYWNLSASTEIDAEVGPLYLVGFQDGSVMGGWVYDPNGDFIVDQYQRPTATTPLEGEYLFVTQPFTLESGALENIFSFDYMYMASGTASADTKNFGLKVRETGGEWATVSTLYEAGESLAVDDEGTMIATLPAEYAGKEVELAMFCETSDDISFAFLFNNVVFAAWSSETALAAEIRPTLISTANHALDMTFRNAGTSTVTSAEMAWRIGDGAVSTVPVEMELSMGEETTASVELNAADLAVGQVYTLQVWNSLVNGEAVAEPDTMEWSFVYVDEQEVPNHIPLVEEFTSSQCGPCAMLNRTLNPVLEEYVDAEMLNVVKYQWYFPGGTPTRPGDRYYLSDLVRDSYYGVNGVPAPFFDGSINMQDWIRSSWNDVSNTLPSYVEEAAAEKSMLRMAFPEATLDTTTGMLNVTVEIMPYVDMEGCRLFVVAIEGVTTGNRGGNGEREFHYVAMDLARPSGEEVELKAGQTVSVSYEMDMSQTNTEEYSDLDVVCFVQNYASHDVYQSVRYDFAANTAILSNEMASLPGVVLYPNPARDYAILSGLNNATVQIFDLTGRMVYEVAGADAMIELPVEGFNAGSYIIRISQDGKTAVRRLNVVR